MRSVADELARELRDRVARLSPGERIHLSLELGEQAVAFYRARHGYAGGTQDQTDIRLPLATPPGMAARETVDAAVAALPRDARALWRRLRG